MHPVAFQIGSLTIHWYGVMVALAFVAGLWTASRRGLREGFAPERIMDLGPWLIARLGPRRAAALSASAGIVRWTAMATTNALPVLATVQALHGLTFALLHLVAMGTIARTVPDRLSATAQTVYGTGALGLASAVMTVASGYLYGWFGMPAFLAMAALCAVALPLIRGIDTASTGS